jgi:hypothetical protein
MARRGDGIYQRGGTWWLDAEPSPMSVSGQIGARPEDGRRRGRRGSSTAPLMVMACVVFLVTCSAWASTSALASSSVSATATHPQEHDAAHDPAMTARRIAPP